MANSNDTLTEVTAAIDKVRVRDPIKGNKEKGSSQNELEVKKYSHRASLIEPS
jgi:hypothetical protein